MNDIIVNGKVYPMWQQFIQRQDEWIGGVLEDQGDSMDRALKLVNEGKPMQTTIMGIELKPNGKDSAYFQVVGVEFSCASDVQFLGVTAGEEGWITLSGYGGQIFRFKQP